MNHPITRRGSAPIQLSVVIPAHNAENVIGETIRRLTERLHGRTSEIIVVENGSTDSTLTVCQAIQEARAEPSTDLRVLVSERGMGSALLVGIRASRGNAVLLTADDLPFGFSDLDGWDVIAAGQGPAPLIVIGSKAHRRSDTPRGWVRSILTAGFSVARRLVLSMRTGDPQGTFIVSGDLVRSIAPHLTETGFLFTTELVYVAERLGIAPVEIPVLLDPHHGEHGSRVRLRDAVLMAVGLARVRWQHRRSRMSVLARPHPR